MAISIIRCILGAVALALTASCFRPAPSPTNNSSLPTPPFHDLVDHRIGLDTSQRIVCQNGSLQETINSLQRLQEEPNRALYRSTLDELTSTLFQQTASSNDPEDVIMTLIATTECHHPLSENLARTLIRSSNPYIQLSTIQALSFVQTSEANDIFVEALRSDYPIIRLEAAWRLSCTHAKDCFFHIDALHQKLPAEYKRYSPELFAIEGSAASVRRLRQFLFDQDDQVVIATLISCGQHRIGSLSDLLFTIKPHSPDVTEALAFALRAIDSEESRSLLRALASSEHPCVQIQACLSLIDLGELSFVSTIQSLAQHKNPFALAALSSFNSDSVPPEPPSASRIVSLNTTLTMLTQKNPLCVPKLFPILSPSSDGVIIPSSSVGHSLMYWDVVPIESFDREIQPMVREQALTMKEAVLIQALDLDEQSFLSIARHIFDEQNTDLFPCLFELLENQRSDATVALLLGEQNRVGAPYNRAFATLALLRLGVLKNDSCLREVIQFSRSTTEQSWRPILPWVLSSRSDETEKQQHTATAARLYIGAIQTLANRQTPESAQILSEELTKAPKKYLPMIAASYLQTYM